MRIARIAAEGYERGGDDYERARPSYPPRAVALLVEELGIGPGRTVLDLAAGTGKLTRLLRPTGATLVAVEPVAAMRRHLESVPDVQVVAGTAEAIPCANASIDAVAVATAFHWFRGDQALAEISRVLKPGGGLGLVWNNPDQALDWVAEIWGLVDAKRRGAPRNRDLSWQAAFASAPGFTPLQHESFFHSQRLGIDDLIARVNSIAFVASLPPAEREDLLARVREIVGSHPDVAAGDELRLPYRTDVYWCRKTPRG